MGEAPLVSIIIPARDAAETIGAALASVQAQSYRHWEAIVVDDGSSDATATIVRAHAAIEPRLRLLQRTGGNAAAARNLAVAHARGEFIALLDADDLWHPDKLEYQLARLFDTGTRLGMVYSWSWILDADGRCTSRMIAISCDGDAYASLVLHNIVGNGSAALIRKDCLQAVGGFDELLHGCQDLKSLSGHCRTLRSGCRALPPRGISAAQRWHLLANRNYGGCLPSHHEPSKSTPPRDATLSLSLVRRAVLLHPGPPLLGAGTAPDGTANVLPRPPARSRVSLWTALRGLGRQSGQTPGARLRHIDGPNRSFSVTSARGRPGATCHPAAAISSRGCCSHRMLRARRGDPGVGRGPAHGWERMLPNTDASGAVVTEPPREALAWRRPAELLLLRVETERAPAVPARPEPTAFTVNLGDATKKRLDPRSKHVSNECVDRS